MIDKPQREMKSKKIKLQLNKETIAKLNDVEMGNLNGGAALQVDVVADGNINLDGEADFEVAEGSKLICSVSGCKSRRSCNVILCIPI